MFISFLQRSVPKHVAGYCIKKLFHDFAFFGITVVLCMLNYCKNCGLFKVICTVSSFLQT
jgi:hypothetical protein